MKPIVTMAALSLVLATPLAWAQQASEQAPDSEMAAPPSGSGAGAGEPAQGAMGAEQQAPGGAMGAERQAGAQGATPGIMQMTAEDIADRPVYAADGRNIAEIDRVVINPSTNEPFAVFDVGGFLGIGADTVAVPFSDMRMIEDGFQITQQATEDDLATLYPYQEDLFTELQQGETLASALGADGAGQAGQTSMFQQLDQDGDGVISPAEVAGREVFTNNWQDIDQNQDGVLDQGEFSAFEQEMQRQHQQPGMQYEDTPQQSPQAPMGGGMGGTGGS